MACRVSLHSPGRLLYSPGRLPLASDFQSLGLWSFHPGGGACQQLEIPGNVILNIKVKSHHQEPQQAAAGGGRRSWGTPLAPL